MFSGSKGIHFGCETGWNVDSSPGRQALVRNNSIRATTPMIDGPGSNVYTNDEGNLSTYDHMESIFVAHNFFTTETTAYSNCNLASSAEYARYWNNVFDLNGSNNMIRAGLYAHLHASAGSRKWTGNLFDPDGVTFQPIGTKVYSSYSAFNSSGYSGGNNQGTISRVNSKSEYFYDHRASDGTRKGAVALTTATNHSGGEGVTSKTLKVAESRWFFDRVEHPGLQARGWGDGAVGRGRRHDHGRRQGGNHRIN